MKQEKLHIIILALNSFTRSTRKTEEALQRVPANHGPLLRDLRKRLAQLLFLQNQKSISMDVEKMKLANYFSLEETLAYIQSLFDLGEKAAGTKEELEATNLIEKEFRKLGLENVRREPFAAVSRTYKDCQLKILEPSVETVPCVNGGTSVPTPPQGIRADLIDAGFGIIKDYERLKKRGVDTKGKIALIERSDRLTGWPDIPCRLAKDFGVEAVIFTAFFSEHKAFRKDAFPFAPIPVVSVPYEVAQSLRGKIREQNVKVELKNMVEPNEDGVSYNVTGELVGSKYPEEIITLTTHHDTWFGGANDNVSAVAIILEIAKILSENFKPRRTLRFISFGAEESGSKNFFEWSVGSFEYVNKHSEEMKNIIANINLDVPAFGDTVLLRATPEMTTFVEESVKNLDLETFFKVTEMPTTSTDHWSFVMRGVPSVNFGLDMPAYEKIYHTNYDTPANVSRYLLEYSSKFVLSLTSRLDSTDVLPYDFLPTVNKLENDLSSRRVKTRGVIDTSRLLKKTRKLKALTQEFNELKSRKIEKDVKFINRSQLEICSLLNRQMIGTGKEINKDAAWVIAECLDMLVSLKAAVEALQNNDLDKAIESLGSLRTMNWGL
ncbi:M20/M25/M40 family metallo-hydrolase, partial [Candidatus Bathyarchaeota archaeon]|nr:M20/M25/M40 family metallo-hydrolase [Candidatus Bathyarchaeota archaeon]